MARRVVEGVEFQSSSGNVFADLELPDADELKIKSGLLMQITRAIRQRGLTQQQAAREMGTTQPKVSALLRGELLNVSEAKLMEYLARLGYDIAIAVTRADAEVGRRSLELTDV